MEFIKMDVEVGDFYETKLKSALASVWVKSKEVVIGGLDCKNINDATEILIGIKKHYKNKNVVSSCLMSDEYSAILKKLGIIELKEITPWR